MRRRLLAEAVLVAALASAEAARALERSTQRRRLAGLDARLEAAERGKAAARRETRDQARLAESAARTAHELAAQLRVAQIDLSATRERERDISARLREFVFRSDRWRDELAHVSLACKVPGGLTIPEQAEPELSVESAAILAITVEMGGYWIEEPNTGWDGIAVLVRAGYLTARSTIVPGKLHLLPTHEGAKYVRRYALDTFFGAVQWQPR